MYCESVLGTIEDGEGKYGGELLRSLEAFLEHNGQWEGRGARALLVTGTRFGTASAASRS